MKTPLTILAVLLLAPLAALRAADRDPLAQEFAKPPMSVRPRVYWYWMNGNLSKEGITRDLEAMKRTGLGGALATEVACGIPEGTVHTLSPQWMELVRHAIRESDRLGLQLAFFNGTGWSGSQGVWVKPENAMQQVVSSETRVKGATHFKGRLAQPYTQAGFYRDISVFAVPAVEGDMQEMKPRISTDPVGVNVRIMDLHDTGNATLPPLPDEADVLADGDPNTALRLPARREGEPIVITLEYPTPFTARSLTVVPGFWQSYEGELQVSADGVHYRKTFSISIPSEGPVTRVVRTLSFEPETARWFRIVIDKSRSPISGRVELSELRLGGGARVDAWESLTGLIAAIGPRHQPRVQPADVIKPESMVDLSSRLQPDGRLEWDVPQGDWIVVRMGHTAFSIPYDTPPKWAQGLETDKLSREALAVHWSEYMDKIVKRAGPMTGKALAAVHTDSWECGSQNWTPRFREEFTKRRGYDMTPYLPALTGRVVGNVEQTERFFWDMRRTIADLIADNYFGGLAELAHTNGLQFTTEAYGNAVMDAFQCAGRADIPMTEIWTSECKRKPEEDWYLKWGSSPAHVYGRRIVGAEAFSTSPDRELGLGRFLDHPFSFKATGDSHLFCGGVNLLTMHVYAHQPWDESAPGMTVGGYGLDFNRGQTWWNYAGPWVDYLSRCSYMLQQGLFVADVLYFYGENPKGHGCPARLSVHPVLPKGYDYDLCPAEVLMKRVQVKDGRIVQPDGMSYRYLVVNHGELMTLPVVEKIRDLVAAGATVIGPRPKAKAPGLRGYPECDVKIQKIIDEVWLDCDGNKVKEHAFGGGRVLWDRSLTGIFDRDNLVPDFEYKTPEKMDLNYIHRRTSDADIYFVANLQYQAVQAELVFRVGGRQPEFWYPDAGSIEPVAQWSEANGRIQIPYRFDPAGSVFVVFRKAASGKKLVGNRKNWAEYKLVQELAGPWEIRFDPKRGGPGRAGGGDQRSEDSKEGKVIFEKLTDWSTHADPRIRYYSGMATYSKAFTFPELRTLNPASPLFLDLGKVAVMAEVRLNGRALATLWKPPFRVEVTDVLKPGRNELEITVVNLWANRLIGDEQLPEDVEWNGASIKAWPEWLIKGVPRTSGRITFATHKHWQKNDALQESGLLGPVTIQTADFTAE